MPHQCLKCGHVFEDGSSQLLKGCPICNGNRFFFTKEPLDEAGRDAISKEVGKDINTKLLELFGDENRDIAEMSGKWINLKPKDIRKVLKQHSSDKIEKKDDGLKEKEKIDKITDEKYRLKILESLENELESNRTPETIDIEKPGKYNIDIKGLLEEEPIIIQKDGSYTIHLPSLFNMINKENEEF